MHGVSEGRELQRGLPVALRRHGGRVLREVGHVRRTPCLLHQASALRCLRPSCRVNKVGFLIVHFDVGTFSVSCEKSRSPE